MTSDDEEIGLEPDARALLDAFRQAKAAPAAARERVWTRVESATAPNPLARQVTTGAIVLAAAAGLAWLAWPRPQAERAWSVEEEAAAVAGSRRSAPVAVPAPAPAPSVPGTVAAPTVAPGPVPTPAPASTPATRARSGAATKAASTSAPAEEAGPTELELIARAKKALARGDARATLAATAEHERRFARGMLIEERGLLEIEARCALGERDTVDRLRAAFLAAHAGSPLADRVRHSCRENEE